MNIDKLIYSARDGEAGIEFELLETKTIDNTGVVEIKSECVTLKWTLYSGHEKKRVYLYRIFFVKYYLRSDWQMSKKIFTEQEIQELSKVS
ncbi:hypothetical protein [Metaclostridioides mangenotii]|uniref:hypothetical protein n=1 Tax=Metaclostridioides mangenotii TaxID=1540 RepID=UPI0004848E89|nr:hypothetical protein [Clostridioides mangenotii]